MNGTTDLLTTYISDMQALERHLSEAFDRQANDSRTRDFPQAKALIDRLDRTARMHRDALDLHARALRVPASSTVKETVTSALGMAAGMLDKIRTYPVSKMLRDDYTALSMAAISYTMLHTAALGLKDTATAELARKHLQDWTPLIVEISEVMPFLVVNELEKNSVPIGADVAAEALRNTHAAWSKESLERAA